MRVEKDFIGDVSLPKQALYGIQSWRARQNFPDRTPFPPEWYRAMGRVKQAYYIACQSFRDTLQEEGLLDKLSVRLPDAEALTIMIQKAGEVAEGSYFDDFIVPGISGGAGTSINMNINEIIANSSLKQLGFDPGRYDRIDPYEDANIFQSTNDVVPSALKLAVMQQLRVLEQEVNLLRAGVENLERENRHVLRMGYTQMQAAVPTSFGKLFSTYSDALSRTGGYHALPGAHQSGQPGRECSWNRTDRTPLHHHGSSAGAAAAHRSTYYKG
jgi:aspartate ammonia-lyase